MGGLGSRDYHQPTLFFGLPLARGVVGGGLRGPLCHLPVWAGFIYQLLYTASGNDRIYICTCSIAANESHNLTFNSTLRTLPSEVSAYWGNYCASFMVLDTAPINVTPHYPPPGHLWAHHRGIDVNTCAPLRGIWHLSLKDGINKYLSTLLLPQDKGSSRTWRRSMGPPKRSWLVKSPTCPTIARVEGRGALHW